MITFYDYIILEICLGFAIYYLILDYRRKRANLRYIQEFKKYLAPSIVSVMCEHIYKKYMGEEII